MNKLEWLNPASAYYIDFGDFSFWRLEVRSVRYVGGYGRMSWVEAADYAAAEADPLPGVLAAGPAAAPRCAFIKRRCRCMT